MAILQVFARIAARRGICRRLDRPKGLPRQLRRDRKRAPSPEREAEDLIIGLTRYRIKLLQRQFGSPLPRGTISA
jgi:hypothetical protein